MVTNPYGSQLLRIANTWSVRWWGRRQTTLWGCYYSVVRQAGFGSCVNRVRSRIDMLHNKKLFSLSKLLLLPRRRILLMKLISKIASSKIYVPLLSSYFQGNYERQLAFSSSEAGAMGGIWFAV